MFYDIVPCQTTSELHLYMDSTYHMLLGHAKGLPIVQWSGCHVQRSACHAQMVCLSCTMTAIMIHMQLQ